MRGVLVFACPIRGLRGTQHALSSAFFHRLASRRGRSRHSKLRPGRGWMKPRPSHDNCEDLFYEARREHKTNLGVIGTSPGVRRVAMPLK